MREVRHSPLGPLALLGVVAVLSDRVGVVSNRAAEPGVPGSRPAVSKRSERGRGDPQRARSLTGGQKSRWQRGHAFSICAASRPTHASFGSRTGRCWRAGGDCRSGERHRPSQRRGVRRPSRSSVSVGSVARSALPVTSTLAGAQRQDDGAPGACDQRLRRSREAAAGTDRLLTGPWPGHTLQEVESNEQRRRMSPCGGLPPIPRRPGCAQWPLHPTRGAWTRSPS